MNRVIVHTACPSARKPIADSLNGLSGRSDEHSIRLLASEGGDAAAWDAANGYDGSWFGASQALNPAIAQGILYDGQAKLTESYFAAFDEASGTLVTHNCPSPPSDATFGAFLVASGLETEPQAEPEPY